MLRGDITEGDSARFSYDTETDRVRWEKTAQRTEPAVSPAAGKPAAPVGSDVGVVGGGPPPGQGRGGGRDERKKPAKPRARAGDRSEVHGSKT
jgi:hypothetical protein